MLTAKELKNVNAENASMFIAYGCYTISLLIQGTHCVKVNE